MLKIYNTKDMRCVLQKYTQRKIRKYLLLRTWDAKRYLIKFSKLSEKLHSHL